MNILHQYRESCKEVGHHAENSPVFAKKLRRPLHPKNLVDRSFKPILKKRAWPDIRFHDLRHTTATLLLSKGVHPKIVSEMLGHANVSITLDVYSHCLPNIQRAAVDAMEHSLR